MAITARDLIQSALRLIGALPNNVNMPVEEARDNLLALNLMLDNLWSGGMMAPALYNESFPLVKDQLSYTIGATGNFNTVRPDKIVNAYLRDSDNYDTYLDTSFSADEYADITDKDIPNGLPERLYYDPQYPLGMIYLYPTYGGDIDLTYTLHLESQKPFTEFATINTAVSLPQSWGRAIVYNFAVEIYPAYLLKNPKLVLTPSVVKIAKESLSTVKNLNARPLISKYEFGRSRNVDIRTQRW